MKSHEYAEKLKGLAEFLLSRPEFETHEGSAKFWFWYFGNKGEFLDAVRALGAGVKSFPNSGDMHFTPNGLPEGVSFYVMVNRSAVCRKVQEEKWECEPLLSQDEEALVGAEEREL